jgi:acetolactate synthase small subunit
MSGRKLGNWQAENPFASPSRSRKEDEEALRWAAIEKLPTYNRLRTTILQSVVEVENHATKILHKQVDVRKLDANDRQEFVERNFKVAEEDNEKFLRKLRDRINK